MFKTRITLASLAFLAGMSLSIFAHAQDGVTDTSITFGQSAALDGPASGLGKGMYDGIMAAFKQVNDAGGVHGRKLVLNAISDSYEPDKAVVNTKKLIEEDKVFALIGAVGTPTSVAAVPLATEAKVPFIGAFTGAEFLRNPYNPYVVNVRGSYFQETELWVKQLVDEMGLKKIAILYQDDAYGRAGYDGLKAALGRRNLQISGEGTYQRNTTAVRPAVVSVRTSEPDAIVTVGAYKPVAEFISSIRQVGVDVPIVNISFTGSDDLAKEVKGIDIGNVVVTQVVPFPRDTSIPLVVEYQNALRSYNSKLSPGFISLEGYMVGKLVIQALQKIQGTPTREELLSAMKGKIDLGGVTLSFGDNDSQGMDEVFLTRLNADGSFDAITSIKD